MAIDWEEAIETAEEAGDLSSLLSIIESSVKYGGDPDESEEAEEWEAPTESALDAFLDWRRAEMLLLRQVYLSSGTY